MLDEQSPVSGAVPSRSHLVEPPPPHAPGGAADLPLVRGRFVVPPVPSGFLDRPRLRAALDDAATRPLTVLRAPAGWGKTALLAAWAGSRPAGSLGWIRVDPALPLWPQLVHSLVHAGILLADSAPDGRQIPAEPGVPDPAEPPHAGPAERTAPPDHSYRQLANLLADLAGPVALILDDVHLLRRRADLDGLELLVNEAGDRLSTILAGRAVPVALHRLRAGGRLTEIGPGALAFTGPEIAELLRAHTVPAARSLADDLLHVTEGWPTGVRLAVAAAARGTQVEPAADGASPAVPASALVAVPEITDFLRAELLSRHPPVVRRFLLRTSLLDRVTGSLADAVVGEPVQLGGPAPGGRDRSSPAGREVGPVATSGADLLTAFAERDGSVIPLDDGRWFRYHRPFAAMLRADLARDRAEDVDELHLRAALWFAAHSRPADAVRHAASAGDWWYASCLLAAGVGMLDTLFGGGSRVDSMLAAMPTSPTAGAPECSLAAAAGHLRHGRVAKATRCLEAARAAIPAAAATRRRSLTVQADLLELRRAELRGAAEEMLTVARRLLRAAPEAAAGLRRDLRAAPGEIDGRRPVTDAPDGDLVAALAWCGRGRGELLLGRYEAAVEALITSLDAARVARSATIEMAAGGALALVQALRGRLRLAESTASAVLAAGGAAASPTPAGPVEARLALALVAFGRADGDLAAEQLRAARAGCGDGQPPYLLDLVTVGQARVRARRGAADDVRAARRLLGAHGRPAGPPLCLSLWQAAEVDLLLAAGNAQAARQALARPTDARPTDARRLDHIVTLAAARAALACADPDAAESAGAALRRADGGRGPGGAACALAAIVAARRDDHARATGLLARALALAEEEGLASPFLDLGDEVMALLDAHPGLRAAHPRFIADLRAAAGAGRAVRPEPATAARGPGLVPAAGAGAGAGPGPGNGGFGAGVRVPAPTRPPSTGAQPAGAQPAGAQAAGAWLSRPVAAGRPGGPLDVRRRGGPGTGGPGGSVDWRHRARVPAAPGGRPGQVPGLPARAADDAFRSPPASDAFPSPPASRAAGAAPARRRRGGAAAGDRLSDRELAVLSYLPTMLTTAEIAAELYVSVNTVKTHLKSIYRKLDVPRRRDAVHRARELHLL
ncbi:LuxR family transcriptional regulator [Frankia sp. AgB32]|uniref:LuxR family transcriptional regulator n=1 Tax=Frankia sp. AgB32 TaxID=631119 RepID=UPI00200C5638|nr:LuxR family transcriptional regulator [Frankia sp. AgB32]MCK9893307.1 LuxR C-terminal-related transcriptional regulator [Frankia sp. AgB32]